MLRRFEGEELRGGKREPGGGWEPSLRRVRPGLLLDASGESLRLLMDAVMTGSCHLSAQLWAMLGIELCLRRKIWQKMEISFFSRSEFSPIGQADGAE